MTGWMTPQMGLAACVICPVGRYGAAASGATECAACPSSTFGNVTGLSTSACSGSCVAAPGSACSAGATIASGNPCPIGRYSAGGVGVNECINCGIGYYGSDTALNSSTCNGPCPTGQYTLLPATVVCTTCAGGFSCSGSSLASCTVGRYGVGGVCYDCPAGRYGNSTGLAVANCTGPCVVAGKGCPPGSTNSTGILCAKGQYSSNVTGVGQACVLCPPGTFGNATGLTNATCTGLCSAGYACPAGSTSSTAVACGIGQVSDAGAGNCTTLYTGMSPRHWSAMHLARLVRGLRRRASTIGSTLLGRGCFTDSSHLCPGQTAP